MRKVPVVRSIATAVPSERCGKYGGWIRTGDQGFNSRPKSKTLLVVLACCLFLNPFLCQGQSNEKKFEIGAQFTFLKLSSIPTRTSTVPCLDTPPPCITTTTGGNNADLPGFGGRFGYNLNKNLGVEAEVNLFATDDQNSGGRKVQALFGAKAGKRFENIGVFFKARPGFIHFKKGSFSPNGLCAVVFAVPGSCVSASGLTNFAFDIGGIVEVYPSKHIIIRLDVGDTIIRHGRRIVQATLNSGDLNSAVVVPAPAETKHNFQTSIGVGFRF